MASNGYFVDRYTYIDDMNGIWIPEEFDDCLPMEEEILPAAQQGNAGAEFVCYLANIDGVGCEPDQETAMEYLHRSADHGCRVAQQWLGTKWMAFVRIKFI